MKQALFAIALTLLPTSAFAQSEGSSRRSLPDDGVNTTEELLHWLMPDRSGFVLPNTAQPPGPEMNARIASAETHSLGSPDNPVRAEAPSGRRAYLERLRCADGNVPQFEHAADIGTGVFGNIVDRFEIECRGSESARTDIHIDMYHIGHVENRPVSGFTIVPATPPPSGDDLEARVASAEAHPLGSKDNPVRAEAPSGQRDYLRRLRCTNGDRPTFVRGGNVGIGPFGNVVDRYAVACPDSTPAESSVYLDMYHAGHVEDRPVPGFAITPE